MKEHDFRYTQLTDAPYLSEWVSQEGNLHWFPFVPGKEMDDALACWIGFSKYSCSLTATIDGVPCGIGTLFLMPYRKVAHHCLFKLIVDKKYRNQGIGTSIVKNLKNLAKNYFRQELMHIEVFEGNPLISILLKQGFKEFARQERFIKENGKYYGRVLLECFL